MCIFFSHRTDFLMFVWLPKIFLLLYLPIKQWERGPGRDQVLGISVSEWSQPGEELGLTESLVVAPEGRSRAHPSGGRDTKNKACPEKKGIGAITAVSREGRQGQLPVGGRQQDKRCSCWNRDNSPWSNISGSEINHFLLECKKIFLLTLYLKFYTQIIESSILFPFYKLIHWVTKS